MGKLIVLFLALLTGAIIAVSPTNAEAALNYWGLNLPVVFMALLMLGLIVMAIQSRTPKGRR